MSRIFLSHSVSNNAEAIAARDWLLSRGWNEVFIDLDPERGLKAGERWQKALKKAGDRCEVVICLISPSWAHSAWCQAEFLLAKQLGKTIFGVIVEPTRSEEIPSVMSAEWQLVDLSAGTRDYKLTVTLPHGGGSVAVAYASEGLNRLRIGLQTRLDPKYFRWPPSYDPDRPPFRGLKPLEADDAGIFFGREGEIVRGLDMLRSICDATRPRILAILGASGVGKSSFMRAGLLPRAARDDIHFLPLPVIRPERSVLTGESGLVLSIEQACRRAGLAYSRADIRVAIEAGRSGIAALLSALTNAKASQIPLAAPEPQRPPTIIIAIDQAEELFVKEGEKEAESFLTLMHELVIKDDPAVLVLFTIRSGSYEALQTARRLLGLHQHTLSLPPMLPGSYVNIINGPAQKLDDAGRKLIIEDPLVEKLLADIDEGRAKDALPLLAFTLERLYLEFRGTGRLTLENYLRLGGIKGSIEAAVERAFGQADKDVTIPKDRNERLSLLRHALIPWLAGIDPETGAPRPRVAHLSEIASPAHPLVQCLVDQRLLATDVGKDTNKTTIEPAHEALLRQWDLLRGWLTEDAGFLAVLNDIKRARREWNANAKLDAWLEHSGERLKAAELLLGRPDLAAGLEALDHDYLRACRVFAHAAAEREHIGARVRQRMRATVLVLLTSTIVGLVGWMNQDSIKELWRWYTTIRPYITANVSPHVLSTAAEQALKPGDAFRECSSKCPEMVVIPAGVFTMGSPDGTTPVIGLDGKSKPGPLAPVEKGRNEDEGPQREVAVKRFAIAKYEVTFDEWDECVALGGCPPLSDSSFGRGRRPAINVSWYDARRYAAWLSKLTGQYYRVPSEAEWEYAARAGTTTAYSFGEDPAQLCTYANIADISLHRVSPDILTSDICDDGYPATAPVGSYRPNGFGLYDMIGNAGEWTVDCYQKTYEGAPTDGSAREKNGCFFRVVRSGSWFVHARLLRSAYRFWIAPDNRFYNIGFRIARTLLPSAS